MNTSLYEAHTRTFFVHDVLSFMLVCHYLLCVHIKFSSINLTFSNRSRAGVWIFFSCVIFRTCEAEKKSKVTAFIDMIFLMVDQGQLQNIYGVCTHIIASWYDILYCWIFFKVSIIKYQDCTCNKL